MIFLSATYKSFRAYLSCLIIGYYFNKNFFLSFLFLFVSLQLKTQPLSSYLRGEIQKTKMLTNIYILVELEINVTIEHS